MTRAQVLAKLGKPLYTNVNGYMQYSSKNLFDVYLDGSKRVRLIGISGPGFCTVFGACALKTGGIAKLARPLRPAPATHKAARDG